MLVDFAGQACSLAQPTGFGVAGGDPAAHFGHQPVVIKLVISSAVNGGPNWMWIIAGTGSGRERGQESKAPSIATGNSGTFARRAKAQNPGLNSPTSPSRVRVPSGKMSTISPRFSRRRVSLMPLSPRPSRSRGIASSELISQRNGAKRTASVGRDSSAPITRQTNEHRIEMTLMIRHHQRRRPAPAHARVPERGYRTRPCPPIDRRPARSRTRFVWAASVEPCNLLATVLPSARGRWIRGDRRLLPAKDGRS